jgi:hypothetical protein
MFLSSHGNISFFNETLTPLFLFFVLFIQISNTSVTGYSQAFWVCNLFSAGSHGFLYWKAHKAHPPSGKLVEKANRTPPNPDTYHTACFPMMVRFFGSYTRHFLNSYRPTMAPPTPPQLPTLPPATPSHLHTRHPHGLFQAPIVFAVSQVQWKLQTLKNKFHKVVQQKKFQKKSHFCNPNKTFKKKNFTKS